MPMKQYESRGCMSQKLMQNHVKTTVCFKNEVIRTLAKFQQCVRTVKSCFIVHQILCLQLNMPSHRSI